MENNITEEGLLKLGFKREDVTKEQSGCDNDFYYFYYDIGNVTFMLTNANDEYVDGRFYVEIFEHQETKKISDIKDVEILVKLLC